MQEIPSVAGELLAMMSGDWDRRAVEADVVWLALHLARYTYIYVYTLYECDWPSMGGYYMYICVLINFL